MTDLASKTNLLNGKQLSHMEGEADTGDTQPGFRLPP